MRLMALPRGGAAQPSAPGRVQDLMASRKESPRRGRALAFAGVCAALVAAAALAPFASAGKKASVLGHTKNAPKPLCPAKPPENKPNQGTKRACSVVGSVTGFQLKANGVRHL